MYRVPPARAWWPAVGAPVDRGVRPRCVLGERLQVRDILGDGSYRVCLADTAGAPERSGFIFSMFRNCADATKLWHSVRTGNFVSVIVCSSSRPWATAFGARMLARLRSPQPLPAIRANLRAAPNPSSNRTHHGRSAWPGRRYAVHFRQPGQAALPRCAG